ncbi:XdhC family protein [Streptomyces sp. NPDC051000]|uniref:XdhC family protein n=1 Tax=Streptomyces sp. NPDC051000 TaxID=3155520 RepID=UPI00340CD0F5
MRDASDAAGRTGRRTARLIVYGAIDFAAAPARIGGFPGHRVTVCDARPVFASRAASAAPAPRRGNGRWGAWTPVRRSADRSHDARFDVPLLALALAHVGAVGSRAHRRGTGRSTARGGDRGRARRPIAPPARFGTNVP